MTIAAFAHATWKNIKLTGKTFNEGAGAAVTTCVQFVLNPTGNGPRPR